MGRISGLRPPLRTGPRSNRQCRADLEPIWGQLGADLERTWGWKWRLERKPPGSLPYCNLQYGTPLGGVQRGAKKCPNTRTASLRGQLRRQRLLRGHLGAILGPTWGHLGANLGPPWANLGRLGGLEGLQTGLGRRLRPKSQTWGQLGPNLGPF